ncbi:MAG: hypothetical protein QXH02_05750 [Desulfurococcaceae archaeon]
MCSTKHRRKRLLHGLAGGVFLVGLAVLFHFGALWPWILALVGVLAVIESVAAYYE